MENSMIHILCATDNNYAPYYGIMLTSLFLNNPESVFSVHILMGEEPVPKVRDDYQKLALFFGQDIQFIKVDESLLFNCPIRIGDHVTLATYYRLIAPLVLPQDIDKILYLDGDIIVDSPIGDLWNTDISTVGIGASIDESYHEAERYDRLELNRRIPYSSAGVLLINLKYWKEHNVMERCLSYINQLGDRLLFHDQDTLNVVLQNEKVFFPIKYNFQSGFIRPWNFNNYDYSIREEILNSVHNPSIIHYSGPGKPWFKFNDHPFKRRFLYYKKMSLWNGTPQINDQNPYSSLRILAGRVLRMLHLKPMMYIKK